MDDGDFVVERFSTRFGQLVRIFTPDPKVRVGTVFQSVCGDEAWYIDDVPSPYSTEAAAIAAIVDRYRRIVVAGLGGGSV